MSDAFQVDSSQLYRHASNVMAVRIHVESNGAVRQVEIVKSTGSDSADQDVKVALYQWWFEPPKDKAGVALADVVEFPIIWR